MELVQLQKENFKFPDVPMAHHKGTKILVVEDDLGAQPLWERMIEVIDPKAMVRWATTEEGAERLIRDRKRMGDEFDVIVADVMLGGAKTGIDLWKRYGGHRSQFLFTTGVSRKKFNEMVGDWTDGFPFLVQKPLNPRECLVCLRVMLGISRI